MKKLINISEATKTIGIIDKKSKKPVNSTLRYWETKFKQIKPKKINNRRYFTQKQVELLKMIKFLLKNKGMTISGVKNLLNSNINKLDENSSISLKNDYLKNTLKLKSKNILDKISKLKQYGKKNTSQSKNGSRK